MDMASLGIAVTPNDGATGNGRRAVTTIENWLESERERLPLLIPVAIGLGISFWQLHGPQMAPVLFAVCLGIIGIGFSLRRASRLSLVLIAGALLVITGYAAISVKSVVAGSVSIERPWTGRIAGKIENVEDVSARGIVRLRLYLGDHPQLPKVIRVNVDKDVASAALVPGTIIAGKVRLIPPPGPALPGSYDFARTAWFAGIGATGRVMGRIEVVTPARTSQNFWNSARNYLSAHIQRAMGDDTGPVGSALLVGARGGIDEADAEALRNAGMAHLLSVSGLHVTAVVGGCFVLAASMLAFWPWFALRVPVPLVAAAFSAIVAVLYTLLTGAEVPTVRACIAALLILIALAMGRDALSLRLLAAGATFVLLFWPESLAGPSFQLSFAAVGTIIVLHESPFVRNWMARREEGWLSRVARQASGLLLTGLAIEMVLAPIALFHFHKSGLYGALANIVAIPLTTFAIMPAQLLGLLFDQLWSGLGWPFWWIASLGIKTILSLAHGVSNAPGAIALLPEMPLWAFATMVLSGLVMAIFSTRKCFVALVPAAIAAIFMITAPRPDMLLTGDGQHLAVAFENGKLALLRPGAGDYARSILGETAAVSDVAVALEEMPGTRCNDDGCSFALKRGTRVWHILALRSGYMIPSMELAAACRRSDIVISSRRLPWSCRPRWLKADAALLDRSGGMAFYLDKPRVSYVAQENAHLPWSAYAPERLQSRAERRAKEKAARIVPPPFTTEVKSAQ